MYEKRENAKVKRKQLASFYCLYPEFYEDFNKRYGADTYALRCELGDRNNYYLCAEGDKVFLEVSVYIETLLRVCCFFLKELNQTRHLFLARLTDFFFFAGGGGGLVICP